MRDNWGRESVKGRWCGAHWVESEVRGRFRSSPGGPQLTQPWVRRVSLRALGTDWGLHPAGLQGPHQDRPLAGPGLEAVLNVSPIPVSETYWQWPAVWVTVCEIWSPHLGCLRRPKTTWEGCLALRDDSWAGCGNLAQRSCRQICLLLARTGTLEGKVPLLWDFALSYQDRE